VYESAQMESGCTRSQYWFQLDLERWIYRQSTLAVDMKATL